MEVEPESKDPSSREPLPKRLKRTTISEGIWEASFQDEFARNWEKGEPFETPDITLITKPFRLAKISNFIESETFMEELKMELAEVKSRRQSIDLYQFERTSDLSNVDSTNLRRLREVFKRDFGDWMERNLKIELNRKISMSSSVYYDTDYLLCHDDNMGDRRIAFVLYLSKDWSFEDGGTLDLFDTDDNGAPGKIARSLVPEYNSLVFFEVDEDSYHQVSEVRSAEKSRWTINGWFHGPLKQSAKKPRVEIRSELLSPRTKTEVKLESWISDCYLDSKVASKVQKSVEANSYTFLANFFAADVYETLSEQISSDDIVWTRVGPPDVRNYEIAMAESLPEKLSSFYRIFSNIGIFRLLKAYTELDLVPGIKSQGDPKMSIELQRWSNGCYTLMCDKISEGESEGETLRANEEEAIGCSVDTEEEEEEEGDEEEINRGGKRKDPREWCDRDRRIISSRNGEERKAAKSEDELKVFKISDKGESSRGSKCDDRISEKFHEPCKTLSCRTSRSEPREKLRDYETTIKFDKEEKTADGPSASGTDESGDSVVPKRNCVTKCPKFPHQASCSSIDEETTNLHAESEDSDVSDIGDYLSDRFERSIDDNSEVDDYGEDCEDEERATSPSICEPGSLDVIVQFNTGQVPADETIDYIDPNQQDGALIHVPFRDNHLCLAYKTIRTTRLHKYVNHYCKGYFYNLICTYYE